MESSQFESFQQYLQQLPSSAALVALAKANLERQQRINMIVDDCIEHLVRYYQETGNLEDKTIATLLKLAGHYGFKSSEVLKLAQFVSDCEG